LERRYDSVEREFWRAGASVVKPGKVLAVVGAAVGGLKVANRAWAKVGEPAGIGGEERRYLWRGWRLAYRVAGESGAPPLLLVHGVYAGASSYEFHKNFHELAEAFRVYALDLLGCGLSERPERRYEPEDVAAQVEDFAREEVGAAAHLVASSLSAALVVPAAVRSPRLFKRLILVCPTGLGSLDRPSGLLGDSVYALFRTPVIGDALYNALVSRRGLRYYLSNMAYHDAGSIADGLVEDYYRTSHQPRAKYLAAGFVSGKLNLDLRDLWTRVPHKTLIAWGQKAGTPPVLQAHQFVRRNPRAELKVFRDAALLPHDERAQTFNEEAKKFLLGGRKT
jgi:pimeloyl-ACP methyl ester carboxylesterase